MKQLLARLVRVSPAMVVAMLALLVALGGVSTAASITSSPEATEGTSAKAGQQQVRRGPRGRRGLRGLRGRTGPRGPIGPAGAQGAQGPQGATGATGAKGDKGDTGNTGAAGTPATKLFAHVISSGTLSSVNQGAVAASRPGDGNFNVTFNRNLAGCVAIAEIGFVSGVSGSFTNDTIARTSISTTVVNVRLQRAADGSATNGNFNVMVFCSD